LDQREIEDLFHRIDQVIGKSEPRKAEYWRGYREGIRFRSHDNTWASYRDHYHLQEIANRIVGDSHVVAYARGYRDGCKEETLCLVLADEEGHRDPEAR
jgi:hypothetical protein